MEKWQGEGEKSMDYQKLALAQCDSTISGNTYKRD